MTDSTNPNSKQNMTDPMEAQAKYDVMHWAMFPKTEEEKRTQAKIFEDGVLPIAVIYETFDVIKSFLKCKITLKDHAEIIPVPEPAPEAHPLEWVKYHRYLQRRPKVEYSIDERIRDEHIHQFMADFLEVSSAVGQNNRATQLLTTVKDMARPQMSPFGMLSGMLGRRDEELTSTTSGEEYPSEDGI